jgi:hypothetical protein
VGAGAARPPRRGGSSTRFRFGPGVTQYRSSPSDRQELVCEARNKDLTQAAVEGRVYVVLLDADRVKSAEQARAAGKAILMWCAARETETQIFPDGMVKPDSR